MEPWSIHGVLNKEKFGKNIEENIFQKLVQGHYLYLVYCKQDNQCIFFSKKDIFKDYQKSAKNLTSCLFLNPVYFFWNYENQQGPGASCQFNS